MLCIESVTLIKKIFLVVGINGIFFITKMCCVSKKVKKQKTKTVDLLLPQSLLQRVQLDPLEKEWLKSSALGDVATQRRLLRQDGSLLMKKVLEKQQQ